MFVQIDELPSTYSRPFESRTVAPCPSTSTSGSCSGAHHSRMFVNGCQTNFLSVAISSSVFQSLISYHVIRFSAVFGTALPNQSLTLNPLPLRKGEADQKPTCDGGHITHRVVDLVCPPTDFLCQRANVIRLSPLAGRGLR